MLKICPSQNPKYRQNYLQNPPGAESWEKNALCPDCSTLTFGSGDNNKNYNKQVLKKKETIFRVIT